MLDSAKQWVILYQGVVYVAVPKPLGPGWKAALRPLWRPLSLDHPRTTAWMQWYYGYFAEHIFDESRLWEIVNAIRVFYPEHEPVPEWIEDPPRPSGDWWQVASRRPQPWECPGFMVNFDTPTHFKHPTNGSACHWCGWNAEFRFREGRFA
jgi:hypothetical protein